MEEKLLQIINHYGIRNQQRKLNEESYELIEAINVYEEQKVVCELCCKRLHVDKEKEHITEELADVCVMLCQFKEYYQIDGNDILRIMNEKIDRQLGRLENENNK